MIEKLIYISGPLQLQNELLALFLESETGVKCVIVDKHIQKTDSDFHDRALRKLILLDCNGMDILDCMATLDIEQEILSGDDCFVAFFNVDASTNFEKAALERGAKGFFYTGDSPERLAKGVQAIFDGELWVSRELLSKFFQENRKGEWFLSRTDPKLTHRETEILALVSIGANNDKIAERLCISPHTVKTHIYNIFKKINVPNRLQAALWAVKNL